jgi:hypothetical protein
MTGVLAAPEIIIVHRRQIIVNQRVGVNHLDRRSNGKNEAPFFLVSREACNTEAWPYALAAI